MTRPGWRWTRARVGPHRNPADATPATQLCWTGEIFELILLLTEKGRGIRLSRPQKRVVALAAVVAFNASWLYALVCTSRCAYGVCPHQAKQSSEQPCPHRPGSPSHKHEGEPSKDCSTHSHPNPIFISAAGPIVPAGLVSATALAAPRDFLILKNIDSADLRNAFSHSPPGFRNGRTICQMDTLLRI